MAIHPSAARWCRRPFCAAAAALAASALLVGPAQAARVNVDIAGLSFPASLEAGMTGGEPGAGAPHAHVVWTVTDPTNQHTVTFDDPRLVSSGPLVAGQRHEAVIYTAGTVTYRCTLHPEMTGTVVVTPPVAAPPTSASVAERSPATKGSDPASGGSGAVPLVVGGGALGTAVVLGLFLLRRRRSPGEPAPSRNAERERR